MYNQCKDYLFRSNSDRILRLKRGIKFYVSAYVSVMFSKSEEQGNYRKMTKIYILVDTSLQQYFPLFVSRFSPRKSSQYIIKSWRSRRRYVERLCASIREYRYCATSRESRRDKDSRAVMASRESQPLLLEATTSLQYRTLDSAV